MMLPNSTTPPEQMLAQYGKSFHWAAFFLDKKQWQAARKVYAFCRYIDDLADETDDKVQAQQQLAYIKQVIVTGNSQHKIITSLLELMDTYQINQTIVSQLIDGITWDLTNQHIETETDLLRYSYGVASTVGLIMCPILGVTDSMAHRFAIDLGIAMQLTNMARDVITDATMQRVYLPQAWFTQPVTPADITDNTSHHAEIYQQVVRLLTLANTYYRSADLGLSYLPWRARASIIVASRVYQAIGHKIIALGNENYWRQQKVYTLKREKIVLSIRTICQLLTDKKYYATHPCRAHASTLHQPIQDLIQDAL